MGFSKPVINGETRGYLFRLLETHGQKRTRRHCWSEASGALYAPGTGAADLSHEKTWHLMPS